MSTYGLTIPPAVLRQANLSSSAVLVLSEILNLHKVSGLVWAGDQHFTARIGCIKLKTVQTCIKELAEAGFITRVTNQRAIHKRIITPTDLCYEPTAESAGATPEEPDLPTATAESAVAPPDLPPNLGQPTAESAGDLPPIQPEPTAESADINSQLNKRRNNTPSSSGRVGKKSTKSLSPEVKNPELEQSGSGAAPEPWEAWINENAPLVQKLKYPMTAKQYDGLIADYGENTVQNVLLGMQNRARLLRDYTSANLTCREWCGRRGPKTSKPAAKPKVAEPEVNEDAVADAAARQAEAARKNRLQIREDEEDETDPTA